MIKVILASREKARFSEMIDAFQSRSILIEQVQSGGTALKMIADGSYNLLITDEHLPDMPGKTLIKNIITQNPFMNCVAVSALSHKKFHEEFEGMGVLMQFHPTPSTKDVQKLVDHLDQIHSLFK
ncbi:MAG: response regulator [Desulfobacula sp.]|jgi:DNA-binding response OmpR family regulator|uniref:response regulator n=1 Tax=Desulfobacula sp. TaxID=2593537 RepID=UPI001DBAB77D|nr:response regulator [Desulfobacula sp.]MBT3484057.1 response regulator [Desulfobacula sp.]MBT3805122.1 response regulator [Desulfobacula sp.]MBT4026040.1 response regulator [Desulfobacula sp.]MBT4199797.1 response regulator [Desulfobacula sp.]